MAGPSSSRLRRLVAESPGWLNQGRRIAGYSMRRTQELQLPGILATLFLALVTQRLVPSNAMLLGNCPTEYVPIKPTVLGSNLLIVLLPGLGHSWRASRSPRIGRPIVIIIMPYRRRASRNLVLHISVHWARSVSEK